MGIDDKRYRIAEITLCWRVRFGGISGSQMPFELRRMDDRRMYENVK